MSRMMFVKNSFSSAKQKLIEVRISMVNNEAWKPARRIWSKLCYFMCRFFGMKKRGPDHWDTTWFAVTIDLPGPHRVHIEE